MTEFEIKKKEFYDQYKNLPMEEKINVIAKSFGYLEGHIKRKVCYGRWKGYTDMFISFSDDFQLYIGTRRTQDTRKKSVQKELVDVMLLTYNPEMVEYCKKVAWDNLKKLEVYDNAIATEQGLKPYTLYDIELDNKISDFAGWYQVRLLVDGKTVVFRETGLKYAIRDGYTESLLKKKEYQAVSDNPVFVYDGIGHSL